MENGFRWLIGAWLETCPTDDCRQRWGYEIGRWMQQLDPWDALTLMLVFVGGGILVTGLSWFIERLYLCLSAMHLHARMIGSFRRVVVTFFDRNPSGRLIRRFSSDYSQLLNEIPERVSSIGSCLLILVWSVLLVALEAPPVLLVCLPCAFVYFRLQRLYRPASRETQRLSKVLESPIWSLFSETIRGFQVVRAFDRNELFADRLNKLFSNYGKAFFIRGRMTRWLTVRLKLVAEVFSLSCTCYGVYAVSQGHIGVGTAGFLMSLAIGLDSTMQWLTRSFADLETSMVSVERVLEFQDLPDEEGERAPDAVHDLPSDYPARGAIRFDHYTMSYSIDSEPVIQDFSMDFPAGKKIGIIGRTGAGKSTLFQCLFRMVHVRAGRILIDNVDIAALPVGRVRQIFGIVPQEPQLFSGTIRSNLDRGRLYTDEQIHRALEICCLDDLVGSLGGGLEARVLDEGANLSVGQRQLLCMARAVLADAQIILMDEATASVDSNTDNLIHAAMNRAFAGRTLLIIAHRLETVRDCDLILRMGEKPALLPPDEAMQGEPDLD